MDALHDNVLNADERAQWAARPPETVLLKAGHVAFHHALTVHGSFGNRSDKPRRALVLNFFADGTKALMDGTLLKGAPAVANSRTAAFDQPAWHDISRQRHALTFDISDRRHQHHNDGWREHFARPRSRSGGTPVFGDRGTTALANMDPRAATSRARRIG